MASSSVSQQKTLYGTQKIGSSTPLSDAGPKLIDYRSNELNILASSAEFIIPEF
jgi:hypothetical protein